MRLPLPIFLFAALPVCAGEPASLSQRLTAGERTEVTRVPRIALSVPRGGAVSPKLPAGAFQAKWEGEIVAAQRGEYFFTVKVRGSFTLKLNGRLEIEGAGTGMAHPMDKTLLLQAGENRLLVEFASDGAEDSIIEIDWKPR